MRVALSILLAFTLGCRAAGALAADQAGTESVFVLGAGAKWLAMGRTGMALSDDANALFWNASRLATLSYSELSLFRTQLFEDGVLYHAGFFAYPTLDFGTLALGYQRLDVSDIEQRGPRNELLGSFENSESNLLLGYGLRVGSGVNLGGALRLVQQDVAGTSDLGFGFDLSASLQRTLSRSGDHLFFVGANLRHVLEPSVRLAADEVVEPRSLKLGVAYSGQPRGARFSWSLASDLDLPRRAAVRLGVGAEVAYERTLALRGGVDGGHPTFGVGVTWRFVSVDYAMRADDALSRNDRFTLALRVGSSVTDRREERRAAREQAVMDQLAQLVRERETRERVRLLAAADSAVAVQDYDNALKLYRRVLAIEPDDDVENRAASVEVRLALRAADVQLQTGQLAQAAAAYQQIVDRWPGQPEAAAGVERARALLRKSTDRSREGNDLFREAMARVTNDDLAGAEAVLVELLRLDPEHALGRELRERVVTLRQSKGKDELARARNLAKAGQQGEALRHLEVARRLLGDSTEVTALARDLDMARRASMAKPVAIEDAAPRPPVAKPSRELTAAEQRQLDRQYRDGLSAFQAGQFDRAISAWRAVWVVDPSFERVSEYLIKAYLYEGIASYSQGRYDAAIDMCRKVLEIDPENQKAQRYLERIQEEQSELRQIEGGGR